jgi:Family of unknown function (DUF5684)
MQQDHAQGLVGLGLSLFVLFFAVAIGLAIYVFYCYCFKLICEKAGKKPGALIWIPIVHYIPLLEVAGLPVWMIILLFIPLVNFVIFLILWAKICEARVKSPWLVILFFFPIINLVLIPYLAFSE